jgi:hypothetical protein
MIVVGGYVSGEFGGGPWAIARARGVPDSVDYNVVRLLLGLEWIGPRDMRSRVHTGHVFDRVLRSVSPPQTSDRKTASYCAWGWLI